MELLVHGRVLGLQVLPQLVLLLQILRFLGHDEEDGTNHHHHRQVAQHIGAQFRLKAAQGVVGVEVQHEPGHPQLLIHPLDHDLLVDALVISADKVAVQVFVHVIDGLHLGQGLVDEDVVHIEGMLGQLQAAVPQHLGAVDDRVHEQVFRRLPVP